MLQKDVFLAGEGDAWFARNRDAATCDPVLSAIDTLGLSPATVAEIGCGGGARLGRLEKRGASCFGFDPSAEAINHARQSNPGITFAVGTADSIDLPDASVDLLIFGFCLYLTDPADHFRIAAEADRVLQDGGFAVVFDFLSPHPYRNPYSHKPGIYSHKMEFSKMLAWHPSYRLVHRSYLEHGSTSTFDTDESVSVDIVRKDTTGAFRLKR